MTAQAGTSAAFNIPTGYMGILRGFKYIQRGTTLNQDAVINLSFPQVKVTILVDSIPQANYELMELGIEQFEDMIPCHILANEGQGIQVRILHDTAGSEIPSTLYAIILYGNLLLRTGVPIEYEQGNPTRTVPIRRDIPPPRPGKAATRFAIGGALRRRRRAPPKYPTRRR